MRKHLQLLLLLLLIPSNALAYSDYIIAGGENIGINIKTKGVLVVGTNNVDKTLISNFQIGDLITKVDNNAVSSSSDFVKLVQSNNCESKKIEIKRDNKNKIIDLKLKKEDNICKTGLFVKDSITGIGTLSFIDPKTKLFGALGHEIIESNTNKIVKTNDGTIFESIVTDIERSEKGVPGGKIAKNNTNNIMGNIFENTKRGIFGNYTNYNNNKLYKVAKPNEVKLGNAKMLTVVEDNIVLEYTIKITKIVRDTKEKNLVFEVTDKNLLKKTGGIVQGMSGSPIIQDNKIIGAITHVVVDSPKKGIGIFITNMLEEAEN